MAPIFGKQAILVGFTPLAVVAVRTGIAFLLLFAIALIFPAPLPFHLSGWPGGLPARGLHQWHWFNLLLFSPQAVWMPALGSCSIRSTPCFVAFWLLLDRQSISPLTYLRLVISFPGSTCSSAPAVTTSI